MRMLFFLTGMCKTRVHTFSQSAFLKYEYLWIFIGRRKKWENAQGPNLMTLTAPAVGRYVDEVSISNSIR